MSYNLPKREKTLTVEPDGFDGVTLTFETTGPEEAVELMDEMGFTIEDLERGKLEREMRPAMLAPMVRFLRRKVVGAEGLTVGGDPFDPADPDHIYSLPMQMLSPAFEQLMRYPFMQRDMGKGSGGPEQPSPRDSTPAEPSVPVSAVS